MAKRPGKSSKKVPKFRSEDQERGFWSKHDATDYFDWNNAVDAEFPNLKPSTTSISIRLPTSLLVELKSLANKRDVPYQSLMKLYLAERIDRERKAG